MDPLPQETVLAEGAMVGEYRIEREIGSGGMGTVYGALHPVIGKRAAIKILSARYSVDRESVARFVQEAQAVNKIGHANIVDIFSFGTLPDGRQYLVMEWLQGESLQDRLERKRMTADEAEQIIVPLTRALEAAHAAGVIHRDLKPENVFLVPGDDGVPRVKLLDFGIAKLSSRNPQTSKTATGMTVGTPLFMSPEQARGVDVDARTDLYSLGVVAYAMVCGRTPFEDEVSAVECLNAHIKKPPPPPSEFAELSPVLEQVILGLLAKHADDRPSLAEVRRRLALPERGDTEIAMPRGRRRSWLVPAIAGAVAIAAVFAIVAFKTSGGDEPAHVTATVPPPPAPKPAPVAPDVVKPQPPPPPEPSGSVELMVDPPTAQVEIDETPVDLDHGRAHVELDPGPHEIVSVAQGFTPSKRRVEVVLAQATPVEVKLVRLRRGERQPPKPKVNADGVVNPFAKKRPK